MAFSGIKTDNICILGVNAMLLIVIVIMIVAFNWFPVRDMTAWLGFIISYALSMIISSLVTRLKEKAENSKMQEALDKYNRRDQQT